jgi:hypothetical protein
MTEKTGESTVNKAPDTPEHKAVSTDSAEAAAERARAGIADPVDSDAVIEEPEAKHVLLAEGNNNTGVSEKLLNQVADDPVRSLLTLALRRLQFAQPMQGNLAPVEASLRCANWLTDWLDSEGLALSVKRKP